jgi:hypothetical protein
MEALLAEAQLIIYALKTRPFSLNDLDNALIELEQISQELSEYEDQ